MRPTPGVEARVRAMSPWTVAGMPQGEGSSARQVSICDCNDMIVMTKQGHIRRSGSLKYGQMMVTA